MFIRFWKTTLSPLKLRFFKKIRLVADTIIDWCNDDVDVIIIHDIFRWRIGVLSLVLIPLAYTFNSDFLLKLSVYEGKYHISNITSLASITTLIIYGYFMAGFILSFIILFQNVSFLRSFDSLRLLGFVKGYKYTVINDTGGVCSKRTIIIYKGEVSRYYEIDDHTAEFINVLDVDGINLTVVDEDSGSIDSRWKHEKYGLTTPNKEKHERNHDIVANTQALCRTINRKHENIAIGNFSLCKHIDNKDYMTVITAFKGRHMYQVLPSKSTYRKHLEPEGTFRHVNSGSSVQDNYRRYSYHCFSTTCMFLEFDYYMDDMEYKSGLLKIPRL